MAFKSEAEKKAYEADIACRLFVNNLKNAKPSTGESIQRTDADRLMHYNDAQISGRGGVSSILLGIITLGIPPVGIAFIAFGIWRLIDFRGSLAKADQR